MKTREAAVAASSPSPSLLSYGHLLIIYLVWGAAYLAVKICLSGPATITVLQLQTARLWGAALLLAAVSAITSGRPPRLSRRDFWLCALSGVLMWVGGNGLAAVASLHAASNFVVMALGAIPLWSSLLDLLFRGEKPQPRMLAGLAIGLCGLVLVMAPALLAGDRATLDPEHAHATLACLAGAGMSWALGTLLQRPLMGRSGPAWTATYQILAAALVPTLPALVEGAALPLAPSNAQLGAFAFLIVFASVIGLMSFIHVVRSFTPSIASTFAYVNPVVGILLGWLVLGEIPATLSLVGMAIVLVGIAIILRQASERSSAGKAEPVCSRRDKPR
ncbi:DMT family transporter [Bosea sp. 685]|uniref:DMT family transporter n=1 Tax=Bosea sp. 685 TaxID=3080057 RepID=UPI0028935C08|nr:EamA family transporter [Bosea sp. 685]WNJ92663.1 EamA family transporter [Bosea sp. 685]